MNRCRLYVSVILTAILLVPSAAGQPAGTARRPKIGLVLGGGAALGLSHIGVIQWLEENRIPVDVVAGTSMGGLVGGKYATGADATELRQFIADINWSETLSLATSFQHLSFRRKEDRRQFPSQVSFGVGGGLHVGDGLSSGHGVGLVLSRIANSYDGLKSFDELPIPFGCVATDLISGDQHVFRSGRLFDALRSTMSIPGVFAPWHIDGHVFVDGGTLNNLPVDVARSMGADYIIAVVLETPAIDEKAVASVLGVARRSISVMIANNEKRSLANADLAISPVLDKFKSTDYQRGDELREAGYQGAAAKAAALKRLALPEKEWEEYLRNRNARKAAAVPPPQFVAVETKSEGFRRAFEADLEFTTKPPLDRARLESTLTDFSGTGRFYSANYHYIQRDGKNGLAIDVIDKPFSSPTLNALFQLDGSTGDGLRFGIGGRLTFLDVGGPRSEWRTDANIGAGNNSIGTEYYWRVKGSRFFAAPYAGFLDTQVPLQADGETFAELNLDQRTAGGDLGWAHSRRTEWRVGYQYADVRARIDGGLFQIPQIRGGYSSIRARVVHEGQDSPLVPRRGFRMAAQYNRVLNAPNNVGGFGVVEGTAGYAHPIKGKYSMISSASGGATATEAGAFSLFTLGGITRLTALSRNQLYGHQYYLANAGVLRLLAESPSGFGRYFAGVFYEVGGAKFNGAEGRPYQNGTIGIAGETYFGALFAGVSIGDKGERKLVFRLGRLF